MPAGIRPTALDRSSARSSVSSRTRSRCACSRATSPTETRSAWTPRPGRSASRSSAHEQRPRPSVLVVAGTERELARLDGLDTFCWGMGPVEAALRTARALEERKPDAVVHAGIAGSRTLEAPSLVLGGEAVYCDVIDPASALPRVERARPDAALLEGVRTALPEAHAVPIATCGTLVG